MKTTPLILATVAALVAVSTVWRVSSVRSARPTPHPVSRVPTPSPSQEPETRPSTTPTTSDTAPARRWSDLESADYKAYIANLRSIGCPESTVVDIIRADVHALYVARRAAWAGSHGQVAYWKRNKPGSAASTHPQIEQLEREEAELLKGLLDETAKPLAHEPPTPGGPETGLPRLTDAKQSQIRALESERIARLQTLASTPGGTDLPRAFAAAETEIRQKLAAILTPEELVTYDLTTSPVAQELRDRQIGFELSESEYRELFAMRQEADARTLQFETQGDRVNANQAQVEAHERIKDLLGPERAALYERAGNLDFQSLYPLHDHHGVPMEKIDQAFTQVTEARQQAEAILANGDLERSQRMAYIAELEADLNSQLRTSLGDEVWNRYRDAGSDVFAPYREQASDGLVEVAQNQSNQATPPQDPTSSPIVEPTR